MDSTRRRLRERAGGEKRANANSHNSQGRAGGMGGGGRFGRRQQGVDLLQQHRVVHEGGVRGSSTGSSISGGRTCSHRIGTQTGHVPLLQLAEQSNGGVLRERRVGAQGELEARQRVVQMQSVVECLQGQHSVGRRQLVGRREGVGGWLLLWLCQLCRDTAQRVEQPVEKRRRRGVGLGRIVSVEHTLGVGVVDGERVDHWVEEQSRAEERRGEERRGEQSGVQLVEEEMATFVSCLGSERVFHVPRG